jgi:hypothetical protein
VRPSRQTLSGAKGDKRPASIPGLGWEKSLSAVGGDQSAHVLDKSITSPPERVLYRPVWPGAVDIPWLMFIEKRFDHRNKLIKLFAVNQVTGILKAHDLNVRPG